MFFTIICPQLIFDILYRFQTKGVKMHLAPYCNLNHYMCTSFKLKLIPLSVYLYVILSHDNNTAAVVVQCREICCVKPQVWHLLMNSYRIIINETTINTQSPVTVVVSHLISLKLHCTLTYTIDVLCNWTRDSGLKLLLINASLSYYTPTQS